MPREVYSPEQLQAVRHAVRIVAQEAQADGVAEPARLQELALRALSLAGGEERIDAEQLIARLRSDAHAPRV